MNIKVSVLSLAVALGLLAPINTLCASELKCESAQEDYPKVSAWSRSLKTLEDRKHQELAKYLTPGKQLKIARILISESRLLGLHYLEALINNPKAFSVLRDQAILESSGTVLKSLPLLLSSKQFLINDIWIENLQCLHFIVNNQKTFPDQKGAALATLGSYYHPTNNTLSPDPEKSEKCFLQALNYKMEPAKKASVINDIAVLYHNKHLGKGKERLRTAFNYYDTIDQDETLPIELRLQSRFNKMHILKIYHTPLETLQDRQALIQSVLDHEYDSPSLKMQARVYAAVLRAEESRETQFTKQNLKEFMSIFIELATLRHNVSLLDSEEVQLLNVNYAFFLFEIKYILSLDFKKIGLNNNCLSKILEELIQQDNPPTMDLWVSSVSLAGQIMLRTKSKNLNCLGKNRMRDLIDKILQHNAVSPIAKNSIKGIKACLVAEGLLPNTSKKGVLEDLQDNLMDVGIPNYIKLNILEILAKITHERFPKYNKAIEQTIGYLKDALKEATDEHSQAKIKFILYTYFQAYKECSLTTEEVAQYVQDLSSNETPEEFRIHITTDDDSEDENDLKSKTENKNEQVPIEPSENLMIPVVSSTETTSTTSTTSTTTVTPTTVVNQQAINLHQDRDLMRAQLLLDRLNASRGKVDQREVANMLRRLDYTFQPTEDNGLTIHLGHKGRKNKKGTPGRLDNGRKADLAKVLQDAIAKASTQ